MEQHYTFTRCNAGKWCMRNKIIIAIVISLLITSALYVVLRNIYFPRKTKVDTIKTVEPVFDTIEDLDDTDDEGSADMNNICSQQFTWYNNNCYYYSTKLTHWGQSVSECNALNSSLAVIRSLDEMEWLVAHKTPALYWIGLRRIQKGAPLIWEDGTSVLNNTFCIKGISANSCMVLRETDIIGAPCLLKFRYICKYKV